jgi:hypothetical protein
MKTTCFFLFLLTSFLNPLPAPASAADGPVSIAVVPDPVVIVPGEHSQQVSLDFLVKNLGELPLEFASIVMCAFDGKGELMMRREINRLGMCPSIATLPFTVVEPKKMVIAFNPFQELPPGSAPKTLKFIFTFAGKEGGKEIVSEVTVLPIVHAAKTSLALPIRGKVIVWDGWDFYSHHRRLDLTHPMIVDLGVKHNITRFGMDFIQADADGKTFKNGGKKLEDYYIFGRPVLAAAAGIVADCVADRPDSPIGQMLVDYEALQRSKDLRLLGGNYVVIDHGNGELSFFGHLRQNSLKVGKGERVSSGQLIGEVGSSGDSTEPHLHYQLRSSIDPNCESIPAAFQEFKRWHGSWAEKVKNGYVNSGEIVEAP